MLDASFRLAILACDPFATGLGYKLTSIFTTLIPFTVLASVYLTAPSLSIIFILYKEIPFLLFELSTKEYLFAVLLLPWLFTVPIEKKDLLSYDLSISY